MNRIRRTERKKILALAVLGGAMTMAGRAKAQDQNQPTFMGKGGAHTNSGTAPNKPAPSQTYAPYTGVQAVPPASKPASQSTGKAATNPASNPGPGLTSTVATFPNSKPAITPGSKSAAVTGSATGSAAVARPAAAHPAMTGTSYPARPQGSMVAASTPSPRPTASVPSAPVTVSGNSTMETDFNVPLPDEKILHVQVGHSAFINTKHRLSRVYVTNPEVLSSYTANPNQVVVTAKSPGTSNFIVWDEVGDTQVYMISSETNVEGLTSALKRQFPHDDITALGTGGHITLSGSVGTQATSEAAAKLAANYGKDVVNQLAVNSSKIKQVRLRVRFAEVDRSRIDQFGFNLFAILSGTNPTLINSTTGAYPSNPQIGTSGSSSSSTGSSTTVGGSSVSVSNALNFMIYNFSHNVGATIQDLENKQVMHILAEPNITALSGQKAQFLAGGEFPFPVVQGGTAGSAAAVSIIFKPYGVKLEFTPIVNADGTIDLTVAPEVSALDYSNAVSISGYTIPALSTRRAATEVVLKNGQSFAISGLLDQRTTDALGRTPGIASVPILGALFRSKNINHSRSELVVLVTPEIVDPLSGTWEEYPDPNSPIPLLDQKKFDETLPTSKKKSDTAKN